MLFSCDVSNLPIHSVWMKKVLFICSQNRLSKRFKEYIESAHIVCLNIPDEYEYMDPILVQLLRDQISRVLLRV